MQKAKSSGWVLTVFMVIGLALPGWAQDYPPEWVGAKIVAKWNAERTRCRISVEIQNLTRDRLLTVSGANERIAYREFPKILKATVMSEVGKPEIPFVSVDIQVPAGASVSVVENQFGEAAVWDGLDVAPARAPWPEVSGAERPPLTPDPSVYSRNRFFPETPAIELGTQNTFRGMTTQTLRLYPVRYNPVVRQIQIGKIEGTLFVTPATESPVAAWQEAQRRKTAGYSSALIQSYWGVQGFEAPTPPKRTKPEVGPGCDYLVIVADELAEATQPLVAQKVNRPLGVKVVKLSELGIAPSDGPATKRGKIRSRIEAEYQLTPRPTYLLLVGDANAIPPYLNTKHPFYANEWIATDLFYVNLDGSDWRPSLATGRLPATNAEELKVMVHKILDYDKAVGTGAGKKWGRAIVSAEYENYLDQAGGVQKTTTGRWFLQTAYNVGRYLAGKSQAFDGVDEFYVAFDPSLPRPWHNYDGSLLPDPLYANFSPETDAVQSIKRQWPLNTRLLLHRDHGHRGGWASPPFDVTEIPTLPRPMLPPVVFSINCETGWYDDPSNKSFTLDLMRSAHGASAVIAASRVSWSRYNDRFTEGLIKAIWPDFEFDFELPEVAEGKRLGPILNFAKEHLRASYSDDTAYATVQLFNLFGDPEMRLTGFRQGKIPEAVGPWTNRRVPSSFPEGYR